MDISSHGLACGGEILLLAPGWTSRRYSARGGEILLLAPGWTSLVIVHHAVGRFSYLPQAGHLLSWFSTWWGDSLTRPRMDISRSDSAHDGEILLLAPGWTFLVVFRHAVGKFSYSPQDGHLSSCFGAWWGDSLAHPRLDISCLGSAGGGEILLFAPGWTSLAVILRVVGRFSYSPQDGHLLSLFFMQWGDSLTRPRLDIYCYASVHGGEILFLAPGWTSLIVVRRVLGRFSYSPQAAHF